MLLPLILFDIIRLRKIEIVVINMKEVLNKHKKVIIPLVILTMFLIIGTSYALWQITLRQTNPNTVTTACFKV